MLDITRSRLERLHAHETPQDPAPTTPEAWVRWLESNCAQILRPQERAWMAEAPTTSVWQKNMKLYLAILEISDCAEAEDAPAVLAERFDDVVSRLIEETAAAVVLPAAPAPLPAFADAEALVATDALAFARTQTGEERLTIDDVYAVIKSRFVPPKVPPLSAPPTLEEVCRAAGRERLTALQKIINETLSGMQELSANIQTDVRQARTTGG